MVVPPGHDPDLQHEEVETIPWEMLAERMGRRRLAGYGRYLTAAVVFVVVLVAGLTVTQRRPGTVVDVDASPVSTVMPATTSDGLEEPDEPPGNQPEPTQDPGVPPAPALYTEADLMAVLPSTIEEAGNAERRAAQVAEWYVSTYFTSETSMPPASWVEWAIAGDVVATDGGILEVTVAFQTLLATTNGTYLRPVPRAVTVDVAAGDDTFVIVDLPHPVRFGELVAVDIPETPEEVVPDDIAAAAMDTAQLVGSDGEVVGGAPLESGSWRVVVNVGDDVGQRWDISVVVG